jgi:Beta-lactamase enzyme family
MGMADPEERRRRDRTVFAAAPVVMAVLVVVAITAVVARVHSGSGTSDTAVGNTGQTGSLPRSAPPATHSVSTTTPPPTVDFTAAVHAAVAAVPDGTLSLAVYDRTLNKMVATNDPDTPYYTESVVKLLIGLYALDKGGSASTVTEMIERSDDAAATKLWGTYGGNTIVTSMAAKIGLHNTTPPKKPGEWGDTRTTANDLVLVYQYILNTAPAAERDTMLHAITNATRTAADGNDQYFGIPDAAGNAVTWGVKQGWACCEPSWVLNTTGIVGKDQRYIVIILTAYKGGEGNAETIPTTHATEITAAAKALLPDLLQAP